MTLALLDGDIIAFRAAAAVQKSYEFDGETVVDADVSEAIQGALETVQAWAELARCRDIRVLFTGPHNFRKSVLPTYKGNRKGGKPVAYFETVSAVKRCFHCQEVDGLEADDLMGILATTPKYADSVIVTLDKDLRTIPGLHYNPVKDTRPIRVTQAQANLKWLTQTLTGDPTDNYSGCPNIGAKRAEAILEGWSGESLSDGWARVVGAYKTKKLTERDALIQARVARILTRADYDKSNREVLLWSPEGEPERVALRDVTRKVRGN